MLGLVKQRQKEQPGWEEVSRASEEWGRNHHVPEFMAFSSDHRVSGERPLPFSTSLLVFP